jgi:hypothetical protein
LLKKKKGILNFLELIRMPSASTATVHTVSRDQPLEVGIFCTPANRRKRPFSNYRKNLKARRHRDNGAAILRLI